MIYNINSSTCNLQYKIIMNFSSPDSDQLQRLDKLEHRSAKLGDIWNCNDLNRCVKFVREGGFSRVCLQFSDEIINYSIDIQRQLQKHIDSSVFILADTSYGSCCVDEVGHLIFTRLEDDIYFYIASRLQPLMSRQIP